MANAELSPGDCAYIPRGCGHFIHNIGTDECEIIGVLDAGAYSESSLSEWIVRAPRQLLANNLGLPVEAFATSRRNSSVIIAVS
jgi:oxalate decarboxylase